MILNMGIIQLQDMKDYWSTHHTTNLSFFQSVFSRDRFFQIFGALYVGDPDSTTKKGKIQPFIDRLCAAFEAAHTPDRHIAIDESVISFKGRVSFPQLSRIAINCPHNPFCLKYTFESRVLSPFVRGPTSPTSQDFP